MTPNKKYLLSIVAVLLLMGLCFTACNGSTQTPVSAPGVETTYQVEVLSQGGVPLKGVSLYVYAQASLQDLIAVVSTDDNGNASFTYGAGEGYVAVLGNVPAGYKAESYYPLTGEMTQIRLPIELVASDLSTANYKLGDVMQDFTFTAQDGTEYKLSQLLQTKKAVVLNFFDLEANACKMELPCLQEAWTEYSDSIQVLAMSPVAADNNGISAFVEEQGITFPMGACDSQWKSAMNLLGYPTTVVIDRYGMIALLQGEALRSATEFKDVFAYFTAEDYEQKVIADYSELLVSEPEEDAQNPTDIGTMDSFQLVLKPGKVHYMNLYKLTNVWLQIDHSDVFVEYGNRTYTAQGGSVGLTVSAVSNYEASQLGFGTNGTEPITVTVTLSHLPGTWDNPYSLKLGEFSASVSAGNDQGVYFRYTALEDGYFSLQCLGVSPSINYTFSIMNLTTSAVTILDEGSETDPNTGNPVVRMAMNKGQQAIISIGALPDSTNSYPGGKFQMLAQFTEGEIEDVVVVEKIPYAVTVTDENGAPVFGVNLRLTGTILETPPVAEEGETPSEEPKPVTVDMATGEDGIASGYLPKDTYTGSVMIPAGYQATTTEFVLTPEAPFVSLMLKTYVVETAEYTVRVIDEDGAPIAGVLITIGTTYGTTNADGVYTVTLEKADYTAVLGVPEGYTADNVSVPFPQNSTVLGITLKKGEEVQEGTEYSVTVTDANGAAMTGVVVTFRQGNIPVKVVPVDETGTAKANLTPGNYTVTLASDSGTLLKFDKSQANLTQAKPAATIVVAKDISGNSYATAWWGSYYKLSLGSSWDDLTKTVNYASDYQAFMYIFQPERSGIYRFAVSGGVLGYYGGMDFPFGPSDSTKENGFFEMTVKEGQFDNGNQPTYVLGVVPDSGQKEATITILRTADAPVELPTEKYQPTCTITSSDLTGSPRMTYVDLTGTAEIEKRADGFYYLNGKKLYMNIGNNAPYITLGEMVGVVASGNTWGSSSMATGMKGIRYEGDTPVAIVDFTDTMKAYTKATNPANGLYPLNDDLIYMVKTHGEYVGWWELDAPTSLFTDVTDINREIAWMFAVCYQ